MDKALEQTQSCHMQYESTNLHVTNNELSISNALYYFMCLEMNNAYKLQYFLYMPRYVRRGRQTITAIYQSLNVTTSFASERHTHIRNLSSIISVLHVI